MKKRTKTRLATLETKMRGLQYIIECNNFKELGVKPPEMTESNEAYEKGYTAGWDARENTRGGDWPRPAEPPPEVRQVVEQAGGTISGAARLPDGSGFCTASFPLPRDHWIYEKTGSGVQPHMPQKLKLGASNRPSLEPRLKFALKVAIRGATNGGKEMDFDPDALIMNFFSALFNPED